MSSLKTIGDDRGRMTATTAVSVVVALAIAGIVAGVFAPVALNELNDDQTSSFDEVAVGDTVNVSTQLNATVDAVDDTNNDMNITVADRETGSSVSYTDLSVGANETKTLEGHDITVYGDAVTSTNASFTVGYPPEYGMSSGAEALWGILDLAIVLVIFLFLIGWAVTKNGL